MSFNGIILHEGYNNLGSLEFDLSYLDNQGSVAVIKGDDATPKSRNLLFKIQFEDGSGVPSDYDIDIDLPGYTNTVKEIESEIVFITGVKTFPFTLSEGSNFRHGSIVISDGVETFHDNGNGLLFGSKGGFGEYNSSGEGSVTFFTPPVVDVDVIANYNKSNTVSDEVAGAASGETHYNFSLAHTDIIPGSFSLTLDTISLTDDGLGNLTGTGGSGTINYQTGEIFITGISSGITSGDFLASYHYWSAVTPEVIGEGAFGSDTYDFTLLHHPIIPGSALIAIPEASMVDNGDGTLTDITGSGATGTINYETGEVSIVDFFGPSWGLLITASYHTLNELYTLHTSTDGFLSLEAPPYPVVVLKDIDNPIIRYAVSGPLEDREQEAYLELRTDMGAALYTLITDFVVQDGFLCVTDGDNHQYSIYPLIAVDSGVEAIRINEDGQILLYADDEWTESAHSLVFSSIEHPEFLDVYSDGFYKTNGSTGTVTTGALNTASSVFEDFKGAVLNPEPYFLNATVSVFEPGADRPLKTVDFNNIMPGSMDFKVVTITADPYQAADTSPTWTDIQTASGITFSTAFREFLLGGNLTTVNLMRKAGPISYVSGFPSGSVGAEELAALQAHVDLYTMNSNIDQNQLMIDAGYDTLYRIANTTKDKFLEDVVDEDLPLFRAAQIHESAVQNQKLVSNLLAGTLSDLRMANPVISPVSGSTFTASLTKATSSCGCDDCQSNISPFAYMMDLIKYASAHLYNSTESYTPNIANALTTFISLISDRFLQPFGTLNVDCHTLHSEFCRVRLVTEVLEKYVLASTIPTPRQEALDAERDQFMTLVYKSILSLAGTSINELRDVVVMPEGDARKKAAQKVADKLGVPLIVPSTTEYTAVALWLTLNNLDTNHDLTADSLEALFGFRSTLRNVITDTPVSYMEQWRSTYLNNIWNAGDYLFSDFSREGVVPSTPASYKANWKPIVDPDNMGWEDMTYLLGVEAKTIWLNRKYNTDAFLNSYLPGGSYDSTTNVSADIYARIIKAEGVNIAGDIILDNEVQLYDQNLTPSPDWVTFEVLSRKVVGTDTDIILKKSTPAVSQPDLFQTDNPVVKYTQVVNMTGLDGTFPSVSSGVPFILEFTSETFFDWNGTVKIQSVFGSSTFVYETGGTAPNISAVTFDPDHTQITLTITDSGLDPDFENGVITLFYEKEVPIYNADIINPEDLVDSFFDDTITYTLVDTSSFNYEVWDDSISWPGIIEPTFTNYGKLKQMQQFLAAGTDVSVFTNIINTYLHLTVAAFNRLMQLLGACESFINKMYTVKQPTPEEIYELLSIGRSSGKEKMRDTWVAEELELGTPVKLSSQWFWKPVNEPVAGPWDPSLQTIPASVGDIDPHVDVAIIDPELISVKDMISTPESQPYIELHTTRQTALNEKFVSYYGLVSPFAANGFIKMFNEIATGSTSSSFVSLITPYTTLEGILSDLQSNNMFSQKKASDVLWDVFIINGEDFASVMSVKMAYESSSSSELPSDNAIRKATRLLVSAFKRARLYPPVGMSNGWIKDEINGTYTSPNLPVFYYNVLKMNMAPGRSDTAYRQQWQQTLTAWNRQPTIQPDIVPIEDIKSVSMSNWIYSTWNSRNADLTTDYNTIITDIDQSTNGAVFSALQDQYNLFMGRVGSYTPTGDYEYLSFFTGLREREAAGEDIRPLLNQAGILITEYRYLLKIYELFESLSSGGTPTWLDSEKEDVANIIIAINSRNLPFDKVTEEYDNDVFLNPDDFQVYKPALANFPLTNLPSPNPWRSPYRLTKDWEDRLQSRIDLVTKVKEQWNEVLKEAEDANMPLMRDALIRALTPDCVDWRVTAEKLARSFFMETKDNCCVKHTRVSFAIETLQGFLFALHNGIYDDYVNDFTLNAPNFNEEWQWIGSYAGWRSAMFVFIYPENLLYPSLKRLQSPKFIELNNLLQSANRFSPDDACDAGKQFKKYLDDIENLNIICTTSSRAIYYTEDSSDCCKTNNTYIRQETYLFAQTPEGIPYWAIKQSAEQDGLGFWEKLPIETENINLLGCAVYGTRWDGWKEYPLTLVLFYSYREKNVLKVAYIKKSLSKPDTWSAPVECEDLPKLEAGGNQIEPYSISICQQSDDWSYPTFIFSYNQVITQYETIKVHQPWHIFALPPSTLTTSNIISQTTKTHLAFNYDLVKDHFIAEQFTVHNNNEQPVSTLKLITGNIISLVVIFGRDNLGSYGKLSISYIGTWGSYVLPWKPEDSSLPIIDKVIGAFESRDEADTFVIHYIDGSNLYRCIKVKINGGLLYTYINIGTGSASTILTPSSITMSPGITALPPVVKIYPFFQERDALRIYSVKDTTERVYGVKIAVSPTNYSINFHCALKPEKIADVSVISAECITDMGIRKTSIENIIKNNINFPVGNAPTTIKRPVVVKELLYEAFYFVPMMLALDQQRRGQFEAALDWYRSVYDYTDNVLTNRKIFFGLAMEEIIINQTTQNANWLLDPLNPHLVAQTRTNAYTKYTLMNIIQCLYGYADREFTMDTIETVPHARQLYSIALDLLNTYELRVAGNACKNNANNCIKTLIPSGIGNSPELNNMNARMQNALAKVGNPDTIDTLAEDIAEIFNEVSGDTIAERYAAAFALIDENLPPEPGEETITEVVEVSIEQFNNVYRYVFADESQQNFVEQVNDLYAQTVAGISGIDVDAINDPVYETQLNWLYTAPPSSSASTSFGFATAEGEQFMPGNLGYNPTRPSSVAYQVNVLFNNVPFVIGQYQTGMPAVYTPILGYKFCMPDNPVYNALTMKGNVELYKIFNCRNIAGMVRELDVYAAPTDSITGMPIIGATGTLQTPGINTYSPSQYRFRVLIERAKQIVAQAQQMESLFLAALEKEDAENYSQLRALQDLETARATVKLQDLRVTQANDESVVANLQLNKATFIRDHYQTLYDNGLNAYENASLLYLQISAVLHTIASFQYLVWTPSGFPDFGGSQNAAAAAFSTESSIFAQMASFQRRQEEWGFQKDLANLDIQISNQQIKVAQDNVRIVTQERQIAQLNTDHAQASLDFLRNKFTNAELYRWMGNVLQSSYSYMLNLSTAIARTAEKQLYFERQEQAGPFILDDYWETPSSGFTSGASGSAVDRKGLTGSARLLVDITRLDQYAFDTNKRKLQMTKVISLAQNFPAEFEQFRETGVFNFSLTNQLFDYDFPGHYLRLINSVKTSVVALVPTYDQVKATLTADTISYTVIGGTTFQKTPIRRLEQESVALTSANNASGVFDMQAMQGELLNPFEGMGLESRWEFKMPQFTNRFDFGNIADVLFTVEYTAFDSYLYRTQVLNDIQDEITFNRGFSFKNNFPDQWYQLGEIQEGPDTFSVTVDLKREMFPQGISNLELKKDGGFTFYFARKDDFEQEVTLRDINLATADEGDYHLETINGKLPAPTVLLGSIPDGSSPVISIRFTFDNKPEVRDLFSNGSITDIFMIVPCKAELKAYPL